MAEQTPRPSHPEITSDGKPSTIPAPALTADQKGPIKNSVIENSHASAEQFFPVPERLPIQVFNEETWLQKLAQWGPLAMGVASIVLTVFVWRNTENLTSRQIDLQAQQVRLQNDQVQAELADLRFKFLNDLTSQDENRKTPAEISLAAHGLKAFPVIHSALGVEQGDIRKSAVNVVYRLFQAETDAVREELLKRLTEEFAYPNKTLHTGVVQSFVKLEPLLSPPQRTKVMRFLEQTVVPKTVCAEPDGREAVLEAAKFMGSKRADAIPYLTSVVAVPRCGDAWLQAIYNLQTVAPEISTAERSTLREKATQVKQDVLDNLAQNVGKQELAEGAGFAGFLKDGEVSIQFHDFKMRIEKEFETLISALR